MKHTKTTMRAALICLLTALLAGSTVLTVQASDNKPLLTASAPKAAEEQVPAAPDTETIVFPSDFQPSGIVRTENGLLAADIGCRRIWKLENGTVVPLTGPETDGEYELPAGYVDGALNEAYFGEPWAITAYRGGYAVSDTEGHAVRFLADDRVTTLTGSGDDGSEDGKLLAASFGMPTGLAAGENEELYIADTEYGTIRMMDADGTVSTLLEDLAEPTGLCYADGTLYIAETGKNRILTYTDGTLAVLTGKAVPETDAEDGEELWKIGYRNGKAEEALFNHPQGVAAAPDGTVYIADTDNSAVRVLQNGFVYTLVQSENTPDFPIEVRGLTFDNGHLYAADPSAGVVETLAVESPLFLDVSERAWYADAVRNAVKCGITVGTGEDTFSPDMTLTRAMAVTMLSRVHSFMNGFDVIDGEQSFADVPDTAWFTGAAGWAVEAGVTRGVGDDQFAPSRVITREELVTMVYRYAMTAGAENAASETAVSAAAEKFVDWDKVSDFAQDAFAWAYENGIVNGLPGNLAAPKGEIDRAQAVQIMVSFLRFLNA